MPNDILAIPEVLILIAGHLPPADLASACRTCRSWFVPFAGQLWRSIEPDQWTHGALTIALPRYSTFIRELRCSRFTRLEALGPECTHLALLRAPEVTPDNLDLLQAVLVRNQNIEDLWLTFDSKMPVPVELFGAIAGLKKLRRLSIDALWVTSHDHVQHLLEHLPVLEFLHVESWAMPSLRETEAAVENRPRKSYDSPRAHQLQSLSVAGYLLMESIMRDLAFHFPRLRTLSLEGDCEDLYSGDTEAPLSLSQELSTRCPLLTDLSFKNTVCLGVHDLLTLLRSVPRLRRLSMFGINLSELEILHMLLHAQASEPRIWDFIEHIELRCHGHGPHRLEAAILQILYNFPALKRLSLPTATIDVDILAMCIQGHRPQPGIEGGWVCENLEELDLRITGPSKGWLRPRCIERLINEEQQEEMDGVGEDDGKQEVEDSARYNSFDTIVNYLRAQPKLRFHTVKFIQ
ncbi:hypothetical protein BGZ72_000167 [Mortierella alpina]|nr:hypothetical protein BGZ72_000167 [Mortierella alpina]